MNFAETVEAIKSTLESEAYSLYDDEEGKVYYKELIEEEESELRYLETLRKHIALRPKKSGRYAYTYIRTLVIMYCIKAKLKLMYQVEKTDEIKEIKKSSQYTLDELLDEESFYTIVEDLSLSDIEKVLDLDEIDKKTLKILKGEKLC